MMLGDGLLHPVNKIEYLEYALIWRVWKCDKECKTLNHRYIVIYQTSAYYYNI